MRVDTYPYYSREKHGVDFDSLHRHVNQLPEKTVLLLHPCCHNPTGSDLMRDQWKTLSQLLLKRKILPFFDFAYQGLGSGIEEDRQAIEIFLDDGNEMIVAYSCAKNFSLYCQRVGALFVVDENAAVKLRVGSQIKKIIRSLYSNPPAHGARIVSHLLLDAKLKAEWKRELESMRGRIGKIREKLIDRLNSKSGGADFEFLRPHKGMFSFVDLDKSQVQRLIDGFGIYLIDNGRISLTGLNGENLEIVVEGISAVCKS
jgi:aspartate/tyrosine/aromatic aminotransferase